MQPLTIERVDKAEGDFATMQREVRARGRPRHVPRHWLWLLFISAACLTSCGPGTRLEYIIPDAYQDFLVIEYECVGGSSARQSGGSVQFVFNDVGVACVSDTYMEIYPTGVSSVWKVETRSGQAVPFVGSTYRSQTGYALVGAQLIRISYGPQGLDEDMFEVLWVGQLNDLLTLVESREYTTVRAKFFQRNLGIPVAGGLRTKPIPVVTVQPK